MKSNDDPKCPACGNPVSQAKCPVCGGATPWWVRRREPLLLAFLVVIAAAFFAATTFLVKFHRQREAGLSEGWFDQGERDMAAGRPDAAIADLRNALQFDHEDRRYRLRLVEALIAARHANQATSYLVNLWDEQPGDGDINLRLARLSAQRGEMAAAKRYYRYAIDGVWDDDPVAHRQETRLEFAEFLISHEAFGDAQAELLAAAEESPNNAALHKRLGELFLQAGDAGNALANFTAAERLLPGDAEALAGAGEAAFDLGEYESAKSYLERARRLKPNDAKVSDLLETASQVLEADPLQRGLAGSERSRRAADAFRLAQARLEQCAAKLGGQQATAPPGDLAQLKSQMDTIARRVTPAALYRDADLMAQAIRLAFQVEEITAKRCGRATGLDLALQLAAERHPESTP
jgi:tetratricopeptide (TPR) repeat protein